MTLPSESPVCPACGLVLPLGLPAGVCPRCLLGAGLVATGVAEAATEVSGEGAGSGTTELTEGAVIDRYRIGRRIGRGGMGEVYAAEQVEPVKRQVAFKVIKRGMDTDHIISRFQTERQALALMDHPNIAVVLDAGATPAGRPFFVMEFVQGVPLTTFCDDKELPLRARLDLFLQVCGAIQHAHQKGIIHRDLKPSNILVGEEAGQPVPKVIDFGLAKATGQDATDRTLLTEAGQVLGTPAYMSPEQAGGTKDLDTRADVYALGAILYELITGEPPFDRRRLESAAWEEILRLIREEEPPRPSARLSLRLTHGTRHGVPALAGSGAARGSWNSNAAAHEPPEGGTPSTDETRNATSREPAKAGTPNIRATPSNRPTPSKGATRSKGGTRTIPADLDWIVMKALEKDRARRYDTVSGLAGDVRHLLAHEPVAARPPSTAYRLGKFVRRHRRSLATAAVLTAGLISTAGVWAKSEWDKRQRATQLSQQILGLVAEAERLMQENERVDYHNDEPFRRAFELSERAKALLGRETPDAAVTARFDKLLAAVVQEHDARRLIGELEEVSIASFSDKDTKESLSRYSAVLTTRGIELGQLPVDSVATPLSRHRGAVRSRLATELERWAGLENGATPIRDWLRQLVNTIDPDDAWRNQVRTAVRRGNRDMLAELASSPESERQPVGVVVQMAEALDRREERARSNSILKELAQGNPSNFSVHLALGNTKVQALDPINATLMGRVGGTRLAVRSYDRAPGEKPLRRREYDEAVGHLTAAVALRAGSPGAWVNLGNALMNAGRLDEATAAYRKAIGLNAGNAPAEVNLSNMLYVSGDLNGAIEAARKAIELTPDLALAHLTLGNALSAKGDVDGAIKAGRKAIELSPDWAEAHLNLSIDLQAMGTPEGALAEARKTIGLRPDWADAHVNLGNVLQAKDDLQGAIVAYRKAVELKPDWAEAHFNLGTALGTMGEWEGAIAALRKASDLSPDDAEAHYHLGNAFGANGEVDGAIAAHRRAIVLKPGWAEPHFNLGNALQSKGDHDGGIAAYRQAIELRPGWIEAHVNLGSALQAKGEWDAAIAEARKAIELNPDLAPGHFVLGLALASSGSLTAALDSFERALASDPRGTRAQARAQLVGLIKNLVRQEAALIARLKAMPPRNKPPARIDHEPALDAICRGLPVLTLGGNVLGEYVQSHREKLAVELERAAIQVITMPKAGADAISDPARTRQVAADVRRKAASGADFGELAVSYSADSFAQKGGRREITRQSLKKLLSDAAFALEPGQLSPVIEDEGNFYLIRMVERRAADAKAINLDDPEVRSAVAAMIEADRREAWKEKFWRQCLEKAHAAAK